MPTEEGVGAAGTGLARWLSSLVAQRTNSHAHDSHWVAVLNLKMKAVLSWF